MPEPGDPQYYVFERTHEALLGMGDDANGSAAMSRYCGLCRRQDRELWEPLASHPTTKQGIMRPHYPLHSTEGHY